MANKWMESELDFIKNNYNKMSYAKMSKELNRKLPGIIAKCRRLGLVKDKHVGGFKKGIISTNKKIKHVGDVIFILRKGNSIPHIKLNNGEWVSLARKTWTDANGEIPKGYCIVHKDKQTLNCELNNLNMIKRGTFNKKNIEMNETIKYNKSKIWSIQELEEELLINENLLSDNENAIFKIQYDIDTLSEMKASKVLNNIEKFKAKYANKIENNTFNETLNVHEYLSNVNNKKNNYIC
jgi:hypothetical protein